MNFKHELEGNCPMFCPKMHKYHLYFSKYHESGLVKSKFHSWGSDNWRKCNFLGCVTQQQYFWRVHLFVLCISLSSLAGHFCFASLSAGAYGAAVNWFHYATSALFCWWLSEWCSHRCLRGYVTSPHWGAASAFTSTLHSSHQHQDVSARQAHYR